MCAIPEHHFQKLHTCYWQDVQQLVKAWVWQAACPSPTTANQNVDGFQSTGGLPQRLLPVWPALHTLPAPWGSPAGPGNDLADHMPRVPCSWMWQAPPSPPTAVRIRVLSWLPDHQGDLRSGSWQSRSTMCLPQQEVFDIGTPCLHATRRPYVMMALPFRS